MIDPAKIIHYRNILRLSQSNLAKLLNKNRSTVAHWELGTRNITPDNKESLETLFKTKLAGCELEYRDELSTFNLDAEAVK